MKVITKWSKSFFATVIKNITICLFLANIPISVYALADLAVVDSDIVASPKISQIGQEVIFTLTVTNQGDEISAFTYAELDLTQYKNPDDVFWVGIAYLPSIKPNQKVTVEIKGGRGYFPYWIADTNGIFIATVNIDPEYIVWDSNRLNNRAGSSIQVGIPDFEVISVEFTSPSKLSSGVFRIGEPVTIEVVIRNNSQDGPYPTYVECEINYFRSPEGSKPMWIGTKEIIINGNETITLKIENTKIDDEYLDGPWVSTTEDLYIIAVMVDPPYYFPDYNHEHGDIVEVEGKDTFKDSNGINFSNNCTWQSLCIYENVPQVPGNYHTWLIGSLVKDREGGPGYLLRSFDTSSGILNSYAYDQALGIIAFTALGDYENARKILDELEYLQGTDGSFLFVWHGPRPKSVAMENFDKKMVGTNAWIIMAINFYTIHTQDMSYLEIAERCADWILNFQDEDGGIFGGISNPVIFPPDGSVDWKSTEHNLDSFAALFSLSQITEDSKRHEIYEYAAYRIREWLESEAWLDDEGRFGRGENDNYKITDANSWGILSLGKTGINGENFLSGLQWCLNNTLLSESYATCDGKIFDIEGFDVNFDQNSDYDDNPDFISGLPFKHTGNGTDTVWIEGTLGVAIAFYVAGDYENYTRFLSSIKQTQCSNGGIPYSTSIGSADEYIMDRDGDGHDDTDRTSIYLSVAGTTWYIMAERKINPFQPYTVFAQKIEMKPGWNLISFAVNKCFYYGNPPKDQPNCVELVNVADLGYNSIAEWFDSIMTPYNAWQIVIGTNGAMDRKLPAVFHSLSYISPCTGYYVKISSELDMAELSICGTLFDPKCVILLKEGWNLLGYPLDIGYYDTASPPNIPYVTKWRKVDPPVAAYVFKSIAGMYDMVIGSQGSYNPNLNANFNSLHYIAPGHAYWIKARQDIPFTYSEASTASFADLYSKTRPKASMLYQSYPNPFNPDSWIPYELKEDSNVVIRIYTITGQLIRSLNLGYKASGFYKDRDKAAYWDGKNEAGELASSGIYFYNIQAGDYTATKKMVIAR